ncbi:MAG: hypothetical protein ABSG22_07020 [Sedimentisphaerales bacterium]|jgi:hypothetical protein
MKQYERFLVYGLLLILLILVGWFIDNKAKAERYKCWPCSEGDYVGAYILDTKTGHLYMARGYNKIRDLGVIGVSYLQLNKDGSIDFNYVPMADK